MVLKMSLKQVEILGLDEYGRLYGLLDGKKVYFKYGVPGDIVKIRINRVPKGRRGYELWADVVELVSPGDGRIEPRCRYFGECGGCRFQNLDYPLQLKMKKNYVLKIFDRFNLDVEVEDPIPSPKIWFYRNRMDFPVTGSKDEVFLGLKKLGRWDVVIDLDECFLMSREAVEILDIVRKHIKRYSIPPYDIIRQKGFLRYVVIREGKFTGDRLINLVTKSGAFIGLDRLIEDLKNISTGIVWSINDKLTDISIGEDIRAVYGRDYLTEEVGGIKFYIHPNSFFQTNSYQAVKMVELARKYSSGGSLFIDVYSGVGLFTYSLMDKYERVISIEIDKYAVYSSEHVRDWLKADNVVLINESAEDRLRRVEAKIDTVVVDPPRPGLSKQVKDVLLKRDVNEILYFSCNPQSFARDLKVLKERYRVSDKICLIDMFPHTPHIELFTRLEPR